MGFIGGTTFSGVLGLTEGRRRFDELSLSRFAALGAVGGTFVSILMLAGGGAFGPPTFLIVGVAALLGAGSAAGSLALARRADSLLESGEALGLLEEESPDPSP